MNRDRIIFLNSLVRLSFFIMRGIFDIVIQIIIHLFYLFYIAAIGLHIANQIFLVVKLLILGIFLIPLVRFFNNLHENRRHLLLTL
jgi:hypothetical protein